MGNCLQKMSPPSNLGWLRNKPSEKVSRRNRAANNADSCSVECSSLNQPVEGRLSPDLNLPAAVNDSVLSDLNLPAAVDGRVSSDLNLPVDGSVSSDLNLPVDDKVSSALNQPVDGSVLSDLNLLVDDRVSSALNLPVDGSVSSDLNLLVDDKVSSALNLPVDGSVSSALNLPVDGSVSSALNLPVDGRVSSALNLPVDGSVSSALNLPVDGSVSSALNLPVDGRVSPDVQQLPVDCYTTDLGSQPTPVQSNPATHICSRDPMIVSLCGLDEARKRGCDVVGRPVCIGGLTVVLYLCPGGRSSGKGTHASISAKVLLTNTDSSSDIPNRPSMEGCLTVTLLNQQQDEFHWSEDLSLSSREQSAPEDASRPATAGQRSEVGVGASNEFIPHECLEYLPLVDIAYEKNDTLFIRIDEVELKLTQPTGSTVDCVSA